MVGGRGDLFPTFIGERFKAPESSKSQGRLIFGGFFTDEKPWDEKP